MMKKKKTILCCFILHRLVTKLGLLLAHEDLSDLKLLAAGADLYHHKGGMCTVVGAEVNDYRSFPR
jgi:hypothetical protein